LVANEWARVAAAELAVAELRPSAGRGGGCPLHRGVVQRERGRAAQEVGGRRGPPRKLSGAEAAAGGGERGEGARRGDGGVPRAAEGSVHCPVGWSSENENERRTKLVAGEALSESCPPLKPPRETSNVVVENVVVTAASRGTLEPSNSMPFMVTLFWSVPSPS